MKGGVSVAFFKRKHKEIASKLSCAEINRRYHQTEEALKEAAKYGTERDLENAMKQHQIYEYTMLLKERECSNAKKC